MKRADNLWEEIVSFENLHNAFYQVLKGKRAKPIAGNCSTRFSETVLLSPLLAIADIRNSLNNSG